MSSGDRTAGLEAEVSVRRDSLDLHVDLLAPPGRTVALVGPNGAGKTTLLEAVAGIVPLDAGRIVLDGAVVDDPARSVFVPPHDRRVGVVFQDYRLFPHLDVEQNVAFGLRSRGTRRAEAGAQAREWLARLGVADLADRRPDTLSGGQAQRVALARALATSPRLLLLDEPLAALDAATRDRVRTDLGEHLATHDGARVLVTHDPIDALALASDVVVLEEGRIVQQGAPAEIVEHPRSAYVAEFVGVNLLRGTARGRTVVLEGGTVLSTAHSPGGDGPVLVRVHPHAVALHRTRPDGTPRNVWQGRVGSLGRTRDTVRVRVEGPDQIVAEVTPAAVADLGLAPGMPVWVAVKATELGVLHD